LSSIDFAFRFFRRALFALDTIAAILATIICISFDKRCVHDGRAATGALTDRPRIKYACQPNPFVVDVRLVCRAGETFIGIRVTPRPKM
jgi:hypothetical protein